ncbi:hypothetical protein P3L10_006856 [Capsicum annuum]
MAQLFILILIANLFLAMIFTHIIHSIEARHLKFEDTNDNPSRHYVHTVEYATEKAQIHNNVATFATPVAPTPPSPFQTVPQPPPPGHPDGFASSGGPGHSPGIGHSLKRN